MKHPHPSWQTGLQPELKSLKTSIQGAFKQDIQHTNPIAKWFTPQDTTQLIPEVQWHQNQLLHDPHDKKHKQETGQTEHHRKTKASKNNDTTFQLTRVLDLDSRECPPVKDVLARCHSARELKWNFHFKNIFLVQEQEF